MDISLPLSGGPQPYILIVEDDCANAALLTRLVELMGHRVICVETAAGALVALAGARLPPALLLLDLRLPDMDGITLIQQARATGRPLPPVIVLSARAPHEIAYAAQAIGAAAALRKPFAITTLQD